MGLCRKRIRFQNDVPDVESIKAAIKRLTGLAVVVHENTPPVPYPGAFACTVAFECSPGNTIEVESPGPDRLLKDVEGKAAQPENEGSGLEMFDHVAPSTRYGAPECRDRARTVCIEGYIAQEPTIIYATTLALESLGGVPDYPLDDKTRSFYGARVSRAALRRREWRVKLVSILLMVAAVVVTPFLLIWHLVRMPFELRRMRRDVDEIIKRVDR